MGLQHASRVKQVRAHAGGIIQIFRFSVRFYPWIDRVHEATEDFRLSQHLH